MAADDSKKGSSLLKLAVFGGAVLIGGSQLVATSRFRIFVKSANEIRKLVTMPTEHIDAFYKSHEVMGTWGLKNKTDEHAVVDWYRILNHFCALGAVEKMYIAPTLDPKVGNIENQKIFETRMADTLKAGPGKKVMDLGCGRGRIANEVAQHSGAHVSGINYDPSQIENAIAFAQENGLWNKQLHFQVGSFNDPLPFESSSMDAGYEVGAFSYVIDKVAVFKEIYRVLKPGGRFSYFDWVSINYDAKDPHHRDLLALVKPMTGMVDMPPPKEVEEAFKKAGFEIEFSREASEGGKQLGIMMEDMDRSFWWVDDLVNGLNRTGLLADRFSTFYHKIRDGYEALKESVAKDLFSMTWHIVVRKPEK